MTRKQLRRAAFHLRREAKIIKGSYMHLFGEHKGGFGPEDADRKAEHDEMMLLARGLYALSRDPNYVAPNPP